MTHTPATPASMPPDDSRPSEEQGSFVALWLLGLTAMLLVFAALLLVLVAGVGADASARTVVIGYAVVLSGAGFVALAYVRRRGFQAGIMGSTAMVPDAMSTTASDGLVIAATVPPRAPLPGLAQARWPRPRQAQAIAAVEHARSMRRWARPNVSRMAPVRAAPPIRMAMPTPPTQRPAARPTRAVVGGIPVGTPLARTRLVSLQAGVLGMRDPAWDRPTPPNLADRLTGRATHPAVPPPPNQVKEPRSRPPEPVRSR